MPLDRTGIFARPGGPPSFRPVLFTTPLFQEGGRLSEGKFHYRSLSDEQVRSLYALRAI